MENHTSTLANAAKIFAPVSICFAGGLLYSLTSNTADSLRIVRPQQSASLFIANWKRAEAISLPLHLISLASTSFLAYSDPARRTEWGVATLAVILLVPWAVFTMKPHIGRLEQIAQSKSIAESREQTLEHEQIFRGLAKMGIVGTFLHVIAGLVELKAATSV